MYRIMQRESMYGTRWFNITDSVIQFYGYLLDGEASATTYVPNSTIAQCYMWYRNETRRELKLLKDDGTEAKVLEIDVHRHRIRVGEQASIHQMNMKWESYDLWQALCYEAQYGEVTTARINRARRAFELWFLVCHGNLPDTAIISEGYDVILQLESRKRRK